MNAQTFFTLLGGIGLFLFGMTRMSQGLRDACGDHLRVLLERFTRNPVISVLTGLLVTIFIQSSSATDVLVIGFVNSGLMTLTQALGVIMGANIGTTITAQITAFNIGTYAPLILFIGVILAVFVKNKMTRDIGTVILGFGMLFQGITLMKGAIAPLSSSPQFKDFLVRVENPFALILFSVLFTALLQSSSSSTVIFQAFAIQGLIEYDTAVYLLIGAAIGSVAPNLLAGLTANRSGKRCALLNLVFNLLRAALILSLITVFPGILDRICALSPGNIGRQIANTHTAFALISVLILLPFSSVIVHFTNLLVPVSEQEARKSDARRLIYLTQVSRMPTAFVLDQARREIARMGHIAIDNVNTAIDGFLTQNGKLREQVIETEENVDYLAHEISAKLIELRTLDTSPKNMNRLYRLIQVVDHVERISDHAENIAEYCALLEDGKAKLSTEALEELANLGSLTLKSLRLGLRIFENEEFGLVPEAYSAEQEVDDATDACVENHITRLMQNKCDPQGGVIFTDMTIDLERCSDHALKVATALDPSRSIQSIAEVS